MNEKIIENWNATVDKESTVYFLGDFSFCSDMAKNEVIFNRLQGKKILAGKGNHDSEKICKLPWNGVYDIFELKYNKMFLFLCHYPFISWKHSNSINSISLHGHIHSKSIVTDPKIRRFDIGIDASGGYSPISIDEIVEISKTITEPPQSHHEEIKSSCIGDLTHCSTKEIIKP